MILMKISFGIQLKFTKYLKEEFGLFSDQYFLFKYFPTVAFMREKLKWSACFGIYKLKAFLKQSHFILQVFRIFDTYMKDSL